MDLKRLDGRIERLEDILAGVAVVVLCLIVFSVCLEIIMRYFLNRPLVWVVELTEYALLYVTFLGSAWLLRKEGHVRVDVLIDFMSPRWKDRWAVFCSGLGAIVSAILTVFGATVTYDQLSRGIYKPTVLEFPTWIVTMAIPLGSFFLVIRFFRSLVGHFIVVGKDVHQGGKET